ncbi:hypothetical protein DRE_02674 [Drechslerella stenobrocha 248]|uniref:VLRF1 domain-containing protein n=1 Tax=Drechslerella stenobrocha 248 TaxID=1043628 RepID=W7IFZ7_9PEZI|nr:hypothetical protein DRE_02674 [Drechslerella stenobrocha 248]
MAASLPQPAAAITGQPEDLLKRPLYAFDIPSTLLTSLIVKGSGHDPTTAQDSKDNGLSTEGIASAQPPGEVDPTFGMSCALCAVKSKTLQEQRLHAKSDVHRFNMKRKIRNEPPVSEIEFEKMIEGLNESISGSEASSSEDDLSSDPLANLLRKKAVINSATDPLDDAPRKHKSPIIWLSSPLLPPMTSLGIYRAVVPNLVEETDVLSLLPALQTTPTTTAPTTSAPHIFLCMIGGGHFAAAVISIVPKLTKRSGVVEREAVVLAHKTFHRYTTRRKQGGSQAANDASKGTAHSAGSSLRRYNEAALTADIREVLGSWKEMLDSSMLLFIRATGTSNRRTLFGYDGAVIKSSDPRIRGFPFSTRRATQSELMRCFVELTRLKVSHVDEAASISAPTAPTAPAPVKAPVVKVKPSKEEAQQLQHSTTLNTLLRRSKAPAIVTYLNSNKLPFTYYLSPPNHHTPTLLHLAASQSNPMVVLALLTKSPNDNREPADPTIRNSAEKTAYDLAGDRVTREAFRVARQELGEDKFAWDSIGVGSPLSRKSYEEMLEHEKAAKDAEEKERREKETTRLKNMPETSSSAGSSASSKGGKRLAEVLGTHAAAAAREGETRGLSDEAKRRLERERRARAAEERMKRLAEK